MAELTTAADLALRIAALEAQRGRSGVVTPEYLLVGLLSLEKVLAVSYTHLTLPTNREV